jgi:hypothetical protein
MGPANANAGRGERFRKTLAKPATITVMVVGASIAAVGRTRGRLRECRGRARGRRCSTPVTGGSGSTS